MDLSDQISVIFEIWLHVISKEKSKYTIGKLWRRKYFVLLRHLNRPEIRLYPKRPNSLGTKCEKIIIGNDHQVFLKPSCNGKSFVCLVSTGDKDIYLAPSEKHICDFICFFLRTLSRLRANVEGNSSFIVRPEKSLDSQRLACFNSVCILTVSTHGITITLQLSGNVIGQWPLRCIRTYECSGQGRFVFDSGSFSPTGLTRLALRTKHGQDSIIFDLLERLIQEVARAESIALDHLTTDQSEESLAERAYLKEMIGLRSIVEISTDLSFDQHLKKLSRDIYDHLSPHFGERSGDAMIALERERSVTQTRTTPLRMLSHGSGSIQDGYLTPTILSDVFLSQDLGRSACDKEMPFRSVTSPPPHVMGVASSERGASQGGMKSYMVMNNGKKEDNVPSVMPGTNDGYLTSEGSCRHYSIERETSNIHLNSSTDENDRMGAYQEVGCYIHESPPNDVKSFWKVHDRSRPEGGNARPDFDDSAHRVTAGAPPSTADLDRPVSVGDITYLGNLEVSKLRKDHGVDHKMHEMEIIGSNKKKQNALGSTS